MEYKDIRCFWYIAGIDQRKSEVERGSGLEGTIGWDKKGCYTTCLGLDTTRSCFFIDDEIEGNKNEKR